MDRDELLRREREAWDSFAALVARVPVDRREVDGVVPGWSVKDLLWHCLRWARESAGYLEAMTPGEFADPFAGEDDAYWDRVNDEIAQESKAMTWDEVESSAPAIRDRARSALVAAPARVEADKMFYEETIEHYEEHAGDVRRFVSELDAGV